MRLVLAAVLAFAGTAPAAAASLSKNVEVDLPAAELWRRIGPFCSIKDWQPLAGGCTQVGSTRMVKTKDGKMTFVEKETARDDKAMTYSYEVEPGPLPITNYMATFKVVPRGEQRSEVEWNSNYTPVAGKEAEAASGIGYIFQAGLDGIRAMSR